MWYSQENTCVGVSIWIKLAVLWACNFRTPILKNMCERLLLDFWKVYCKKIFQIITKQRELLMIICCMKVCSNMSKLNKNISYHKIIKYQVIREKSNLLHKEETIWRKFHWRKRKYFLYISTKIPENFDTKHLKWSNSKETKKEKILYEFQKQSYGGVL